MNIYIFNIFLLFSMKLFLCYDIVLFIIILTEDTKESV